MRNGILSNLMLIRFFKSGFPFNHLPVKFAKLLVLFTKWFQTLAWIVVVFFIGGGFGKFYWQQCVCMWTIKMCIFSRLFFIVSIVLEVYSFSCAHNFMKSDLIYRVFRAFLFILFCLFFFNLHIAPYCQHEMSLDSVFISYLGGAKSQNAWNTLQDRKWNLNEIIMIHLNNHPSYPGHAFTAA